MHASIQLSHISKSVTQGKEHITILHNISYTFEQSTSYAIKGISGSGKSTLLSIIAGFTEPTTGTVSFNAKSVQSMNKEEYARYIQQAIGIVFQHAYLIPELSVVENVLIKSIITNQTQQYKKRALELLDRVGLAHRATERPYILSGGEQQRVAIIRALLMKPLFLIADEPTSHLDQETGNLITHLLQEFQQSEQVGLIIATHDSTLAERMQHTLSLISGNLCHVS